MGTRRSRHNKGRKPKARQQLMFTCCTVCFGQLAITPSKRRDISMPVCKACAATLTNARANA